MTGPQGSTQAQGVTESQGVQGIPGDISRGYKPVPEGAQGRMGTYQVVSTEGATGEDQESNLLYTHELTTPTHSGSDNAL
jgi:hypothetical protein